MKNDVGRYSVMGPLEAEAKKVFEKTQLPPGVKHTPLAVATQVVGGTNYAFFCKSEPVVPNPEPYNTLVIIYKPHSGGDAAVMEIKRIEII